MKTESAALAVLLVTCANCASSHFYDCALKRNLDTVLPATARKCQAQAPQQQTDCNAKLWDLDHRLLRRLRQLGRLRRTLHLLTLLLWNLDLQPTPQAATAAAAAAATGNTDLSSQGQLGLLFFLSFLGKSVCVQHSCGEAPTAVMLLSLGITSTVKQKKRPHGLRHSFAARTCSNRSCSTAAKHKVAPSADKQKVNLSADKQTDMAKTEDEEQQQRQQQQVPTRHSRL